MFLIAGITGNVGGTAARALLAGGKEVRALVRDTAKATEWAQAGVELHTGDLGNAAALSATLQGVEAAFLLIPPTMTPSPDYREAKAIVATYLQALATAPLPRLVCLSSVGSEQPHRLGNITTTQIMETAFADLPFPVAFVRPGSFFENYAPALARAAETGVFDSFLQPVDKSFPMAATVDIGEEIARLLADGWSGNRLTVELGSYVSPAQLAAAMAEALETPVTARAVPRAAWEPVLTAMGVTDGAGAPYMEMTDSLNSGWIDWRGGAVRVEGTTSPAHVYRHALGKTDEPLHFI